MVGYGAGFGWGFGGMLLMLGCIALIVGVVLLAAWAVGRGRPAATGSQAPAVPPPAQPDALELLRLRLARGEITVDEFAVAKQALEASR